MKLYILLEKNMSLAYMQSYKVQLLKVFFSNFFIKGTHFLHFFAKRARAWELIAKKHPSRLKVKEHFPSKNLVKQTSCISYKAISAIACNFLTVHQILMIFFAIFLLLFWIFFWKLKKKSLGSAPKNRVGRETGNKPIFFLA